LAPTDSASRRYRSRDRGWSFVQVACLVRFLSSRQKTHSMMDLAMPSANSWFGIRLLPVVKRARVDFDHHPSHLRVYRDFWCPPC
jgi:hypothetical protein